jgi:hypothetical protein
MKDQTQVAMGGGRDEPTLTTRTAELTSRQLHEHRPPAPANISACPLLVYVPEPLPEPETKEGDILYLFPLPLQS